MSATRTRVKIEQTSLEVALATRKIDGLRRRGYGFNVCILDAARDLVRQGWSPEYASDVAEFSWDLLYA